MLGDGRLSCCTVSYVRYSQDRADVSEGPSLGRRHCLKTRRHFDVVFESMRAEVRLFAEGPVQLTDRLDSFESKAERAISNLDRRWLA